MRNNQIHLSFGKNRKTSNFDLELNSFSELELLISDEVGAKAFTANLLEWHNDLLKQSNKVIFESELSRIFLEKSPLIKKAAILFILSRYCTKKKINHISLKQYDPEFNYIAKTMGINTNKTSGSWFVFYVFKLLILYFSRGVLSTFKFLSQSQLAPTHGSEDNTKELFITESLIKYDGLEDYYYGTFIDNKEVLILDFEHFWNSKKIESTHKKTSSFFYFKDGLQFPFFLISHFLRLITPSSLTKPSNLPSGFTTLFYFEQLLSRPPTLYYFYKKAFSNFFQNTYPEVIIYPFEDKVWERNLISNLSHTNCRTIGYANPVFHHGHLYLKSLHPYRPNTFSVTGEKPLLIFRKLFPLAEIKNNGRFRATNPLTINKSDSTKVLFLINNELELLFILNTLKSSLEVTQKFKITLRIHPFLKYLKNGINLDNYGSGLNWDNQRNLSSSLKDSFLIVYGNTTAGMESILQGKYAAYMKTDSATYSNLLEFNSLKLPIFSFVLMESIYKMNDESYIKEVSEMQKEVLKVISPLSKGHSF